MISVTEKPWGKEELLAQEEGQYVLKRLHMHKGECCSLQYHNQKHETIYVLSGILKLTIKEEDQLKDIFMGVGEYISIKPNTIHRMAGETDCIYLEASTDHLDDVVRVEDRYGRK